MIYDDVDIIKFFGIVAIQRCRAKSTQKKLILKCVYLQIEEVSGFLIDDTLNATIQRMWHSPKKSDIQKQQLLTEFGLKSHLFQHQIVENFDKKTIVDSKGIVDFKVKFRAQM